MAKSVRKNIRSATSGDTFVGERIREGRIAAKMTQEDLGKALGVTFQQVQKYEKGKNRVAVTRIQQIAEKLGKPVSFFLADANNAYGKADPNILRLLTSKEGYDLARDWFAAPPAARKLMSETLRLLTKEGV